MWCWFLSQWFPFLFKKEPEYIQSKKCNALLDVYEIYFKEDKEIARLFSYIIQKDCIEADKVIECYQ